MLFRTLALALGLLAPSIAQAEWHEASTAHFVVYADDKPEAIAKFAAELEKFDKAMSVFYPKAAKPAEGPANRVQVFVTSGTTISKMAGDGTRGFYIPRAGGNVAFVPRVSGKADPYDLSGATVLRHEYAHHFMFTRFPAVFPIWFSEGFAEYWGTTRFAKDGSAEIGRVPQHRAYGLLSGNPLPLKQLVTLSNRRLSGEQREAIYGRGWLLTHYLMSDPQRQKLLVAYMNAINAGQPLTKAAEALGDLDALSRSIDGYMRGSIPGFRITPDKLVTGDVALRKLTAGEVATMAVRIQSKAGVDAEEAKRVLADARKAAAPFSTDPYAQVALAEAEFDADNHALALAAADRALAADAKMTDALMYRAMAKFALAEKDGKPEDWKDVRKAIVAANRVDPEDPRPLILFYRSFAAAGETPPEAARLGFAKAYDTAPSDMGLRMSAAAMFLHDKNPREAQEALRMVAFHPHGGKMALQARAMMAAIERGESAEQVMAVKLPSEADE